MTRPHISLIVCTRNRAARLPEWFEHLAQLEHPAEGWELILVDNASTDATPEIIRDFVRTAGIRARYAYAPLPGLGRARNAGIAAAQGDILAFTDDDCYPQPDYMKVLVHVFATHRPGFVGGRVLQHNPLHARVTLREYPNPLTIAPRSCLRPGQIHGSSMAMRREVVQTIGGFDPRLGPGAPCQAADDTEFLSRALWAGWSGRYEPALVVSHDHGRLEADAVRLRQSYHFACGAYFMSRVLHANARRAYLRYWCRWILRHKSVVRCAREFSGASRYLVERTLRPEPVPRFDAAAFEPVS
jgi:glycosyltransferase involved in cell wall biosynthesis